MLAVDDIVNRIFCDHSLDILKQFPAESVHMSMTSPPYWGKRSYKTQPLVWDGDPECKHDFTLETEAGDIRYRPGYNADVGFCYNPDVWEGDGKGYICSKCGAWRGELGHEPTPDDQIFEIELMELREDIDKKDRQQIEEYFKEY